MQYQFHEFVLDPDNFQLKKNNQPVELRAKAFHVLAFLLKNRHRMVTKDELLDEVWHKQFIAESTLNSCIKTVRQTLGDDGKSQEIIQTVRGMGYRFVAPVEMLKADTAGHATISKRLRERQDKTFVGRDKELNTILDALKQPSMPFWICYLYGSGGIGKTSILKYLTYKAPDDVTVIYFDCREHEPTLEGFLSGLNNLIKIKTGTTSGTTNQKTDDIDGTSLNDVAKQLADVGSRVLLCIDQFESFTVVESWLRQQFFPALPDTVLTLIASRQAPKPAWYTNSDWINAFHIIELSELPEEDARTMLASRNLNSDQISQVRKFAKGYPLALELAALLCRTQPNYQFSGNLAPIEVVTKLSTSILSGLSDVEKEAIEALSTVHRANEPVLCALLGLRDAQTLFVKLRELPFVSYSSQGIALHDVVRDAIGKDLSYRDPERYNQYRKNAWTYFKDQLEKNPVQKHWQFTSDLLFLIEVPIVRDAYFPVGGSEYSVQPASTEDIEQIKKISRDTEPGLASQITEKWLDNHIEHFYVAKGSNNKLAGFEYFFSPDSVDMQLLIDDPVTASWLKHLESNPIAKDEKCIFFRRWLTAGIGDDLSPAQAAFWVDIKRVYMALRPSLRRLYLTFTNLDVYEPIVKSVFFDLLDECLVEIDGRHYHSVMLDFGVRSIDGWLVQLVKNQLDGEQIIRS